MTQALEDRIAQLAAGRQGHVRWGCDKQERGVQGAADLDVELCEDEEFEQYGDEEQEEEEEVVEMTEEELLHLLDQQEPPLQVCRRLFKDPASKAAPSCSILSADHVLELMQRGFAIVDGFLPADVAAGVQQAVLGMAEAGAMEEAAQLAHEGFTDRTARGDLIGWLHASQGAAAAGPLAQLLGRFGQLQSDLAQLLQLEGVSEFQAALYPGGGTGYKRHRDSLPDDGQGQQRRVTAIAYANPGWQQGAGGCLRLWLPSGAHPEALDPELNKEGVWLAVEEDGGGCCPAAGGAEAAGTWDVVGTGGGGGGDGEQVALDVAPLAGRLVVMLSGAVDHAVLPSHVQRVAVTSWMT